MADCVMETDSPLIQLYQSRGYMSGRCSLAELGITLDLDPTKVCIRVHSVPNVPRAVLELYERANFHPDLPSDFFERRGNMQSSFFGSAQEVRAFDVFVTSGLDPLNTVYLYGHEYGHLLSRLGLREMIYDKFKDPTAVPWFIEDEEHFAELTGNLAMLTQRYDLSDITSTNPDGTVHARESEARRFILENIRG